MSATAVSDGGAAAGANVPEGRHPSVSLPRGRALKVAFVGEGHLLDAHAPSGSSGQLVHECFAVGPRADVQLDRARLAQSGADVTVIFDLPSVACALPDELLAALPGVTLGVLTAGIPADLADTKASAVDRLVAFDPALTGTAVGGGEVWRAIPPPVNDALFADDVPVLHRVPRAMSLGRSTEHREAMLMPAKHHHDLLQVCHGMSSAPLAELCREYDIGVYLARQWGGAFGWQASMHLAAGHLLLSETLRPAHGLERNIDYLEVSSPEGLVEKLDRLSRFPEMSRSVRVRGRRKAEYFRSSRLFARISHDLLHDVAAFGSARGDS